RCKEERGINARIIGLFIKFKHERRLTYKIILRVLTLGSIIMDAKKVILKSERINSIVISRIKYENCNYMNSKERNGDKEDEEIDESA
ncbi:MAG: hypothetical protein ACM3TR_04005, partial [Caulobacteraceae bacterium]